MAEGNGGQAYWDEVREDQQDLMTIRQREARRAGPITSAIRRVGAVLTHPGFFTTMVLLHLGWIVANLGVLGIRPWDPPPFTLLATIASVEAPILALLILMRQQSDARISELREETELQISLHAERQTTALIRLALEIQQELGVKTGLDSEKIDYMTDELDPEEILHEAEMEVGESDDETDSSP